MCPRPVHGVCKLFRQAKNYRHTTFHDASGDSVQFDLVLLIYAHSAHRGLLMKLIWEQKLESIKLV
jgi:hypothetical protein